LGDESEGVVAGFDRLVFQQSKNNPLQISQRSLQTRLLDRASQKSSLCKLRMPSYILGSDALKSS